MEGGREEGREAGREGGRSHCWIYFVLSIIGQSVFTELLIYVSLPSDETDARRLRKWNRRLERKKKLRQTPWKIHKKVRDSVRILFNCYYIQSYYVIIFVFFERHLFT